MAATVVDALVVTLGLDPSGYTAGLKKAVEDLNKAKFEANVAAKNIEASGKQAALFFTKLRNEAIALFAVFTGYSGIKNFVSDVVATDAATGRLAHNLGMSVETLSQWETAAEIAGGSAGGMAGSLQGLTREFENFRLTGKSDTIPFLRQFGVQSISELNDIPALLLKISGAAHEMDPRRANALLAGLGLNQDTINVIIQGEDALRRYLAEAAALGVTQKADAESAQALQRQFREVRIAAYSLGRTILTELSPDIQRVLIAMDDWLKKNGEWLKSAIVEEIRKFRDYLQSIDWDRIGRGIGDLIEKITSIDLDSMKKKVQEYWEEVDKVVQGLGGWVNVSEVLFGLWVGSKFLAMLANIKQIALLLAPIIAAAGIIDLIQHPFGNVATENDERAARGLPPLPEPEKKSESFMDWYRRMRNRVFGTTSTADTSLSETQQGFLATLSGPESGGEYNVKNGGSTFSDYSKFPEGIGPGGTSTASGRYQFTSDTWKEASSALGLRDFSPVSQDRAAWWLANREYGRQTGRDLHSDLASGGHTAAIAAALKGRWPSLPGGSQSSQKQSDFDAALLRNTRGAGRPKLDPAIENGVRSRPTPLARAGGVSETHIGQITINTQATDADGIARGIGPALRRYGLVSAANYGLA